MTILIIIVSVIAGLIALVLIVALFAKKGYSIGREVIINRPGQEVFDYVKMLKNQDYYSKWVMADPNKKKDFRGTDGTVGFVYAWDGNKEAGKGEQEITKIKEGEQVDSELRFERPFKGIAQARTITEPIGNNQTKVKWHFDSSMNYPMNFMLLFMDMDKLLGKDMETSLERLKGILEGKSA